jgi:hypothetical protein
MSQHLRDALAKMRVEGFVWCTLQGYRLQLKQISTADTENPAAWNGWTVLCKTRRGLRVGVITSRKQTAMRPHFSGPPCCFLSWKKILARVLFVCSRERIPQ